MHKKKPTLADLSEAQYKALCEVRGRILDNDRLQHGIPEDVDMREILRFRHTHFLPGMKKLVLLMPADTQGDLNLVAVVENANIIDADVKRVFFEKYVFGAYKSYKVFVHLTLVDIGQWKSPEWSTFDFIRKVKQEGLLLWQEAKSGDMT
ncbi:MAG: hypothetical protein WCJ37_03925 [Syntrophus sp. (in: bacteria)]